MSRGLHRYRNSKARQTKMQAVIPLSQQKMKDLTPATADKKHKQIPRAFKIFQIKSRFVTF